LAHACAAFSGPVLFERGGPAANAPHLPRSFDFHDGKVWPNDRHGLGVEFVPERAQLVAEVSKPARPIPVFNRPDGSLTNW
jgi:L-alanine-DL-glutamate epimerase-like enolase superfamily enzyme